MSIGSWTPESSSSSDSAISQDFLQRALHIVDNDQIHSLMDALTEEEKAQYSIMHCETQPWSDALKGYDNDKLIKLIKFFALAEMQLPGWQAGENSPVIAINRYLVSQGDKLDKSTLLWLREHSTNRFIPNGAIKL